MSEGGARSPKSPETGLTDLVAKCLVGGAGPGSHSLSLTLSRSPSLSFSM